MLWGLIHGFGGFYPRGDAQGRTTRPPASPALCAACWSCYRHHSLSPLWKKNTFFWLFVLCDARCPSAFPRCSLQPVTGTDLLQPVETPPASGTSLGASCRVKGEGWGLVRTAAPIKKQLKAQLRKARQSPAAWPAGPAGPCCCQGAGAGGQRGRGLSPTRGRPHSDCTQPSNQ